MCTGCTINLLITRLALASHPNLHNHRHTALGQTSADNAWSGAEPGGFPRTIPGAEPGGFPLIIPGAEPGGFPQTMPGVGQSRVAFRGQCLEWGRAVWLSGDNAWSGPEPGGFPQTMPGVGQSRVAFRRQCLSGAEPGGFPWTMPGVGQSRVAFRGQCPGQSRVAFRRQCLEWARAGWLSTDNTLSRAEPGGFHQWREI
ncbi:hypothetical protein ACOMHN_048714 [Nucella lapillus]